MMWLDNYFVLNGLVIVLLAVNLLFFSWIFTRYALQVPFSFSKITVATAIGALIVFVGVVINKYYPLTFFTIMIPSSVCAVVVHCLIVTFNIYLQQKQNQGVLIFPKFLALVLNYSFFSLLAVIMIYSNNPILINFFYYITESCIKVGVITLLYLLLQLKEPSCVIEVCNEEPQDPEISSQDIPYDTQENEENF